MSYQPAESEPGAPYSPRARCPWPLSWPRTAGRTGWNARGSSGAGVGRARAPPPGRSRPDRPTARCRRRSRPPSRGARQAAARWARSRSAHHIGAGCPRAPITAGIELATMSTPAQMQGRVAWVTGAGSGMGARHAQRLAEAGAKVACFDIDLATVERVADSIRSDGGEAIALAADVGDWAALSAAAEQAARELGPVSAVVANAGVLGPVASIRNLDPGAWDQVIRVNLTGVFHTAKAAIPQLGEGGGMVLVSSISGLRGYAEAGAYNASKHGVIGLMRTLANELAPMGVRVNAICAGWVDTPMFDAQVEIAGFSKTEAVTRWAPDQLIERLVTPDEVSDAVLWLLSPAARMITGVSLPIDGGMLERTLAQT